jgi:large subunit ribosomal protein L16
MVLFPKKTKFKKFFKFKNFFNKFDNRCIVPKAGASSLKIVKGGRVSSFQLEAVRKVCKRKLRLKFRKETPRFNIFTDIVVTKKSSGVRMGKGKGSLNFWASFSNSGRVILELSSNINKFSAAAALKAAAFKLPFKTKLVFK